MDCQGVPEKPTLLRVFNIVKVIGNHADGNLAFNAVTSYSPRLSIGERNREKI